jgi:outer membrane protein assembly factor BamB
LLSKQDILKSSGNKNMKTKKFGFAFMKTESILVLIVCLIYLSACFPQRKKDFNVESPQIAHRIVTDVSLPFHEQWRKSNLLLFNTDADRLYVYDNQLLFVSFEEGGNTMRLKSLNAKTGAVLWETEPLPFYANSLAIDAKRVYLALSSKIIVYDLSTGEVLWEDALLGGRTAYWVYPMGGTLLIYSEEDVSSQGDEEQVIRKYDTQSGLLMSVDRIGIDQKYSSLLLKTLTHDYWTDTEMLWAINNETKEEQWKVAIDNRVQYQPLLVDTKLIFASGIFSDLIGIDNISGHQIWKYEAQIVSDLTAKSGIVYAIRKDAEIVAIDSSTGKEVGHIGVEPRVTETSTRSNAYLIAVSEDMLFVYYGDSQELIAFSK